MWVGGGPACGDGFVDDVEACDDGDGFDGDGCNNDCSASCGDGDVNVVAIAGGGFADADAHAVDVDADGFDDLVIVELGSTTPSLEVALGSARGLLPAVAVAQLDFGTDAAVVSGSAIADVDGDDVLDVALFRGGECGIAVARGDGFGSFSEAPLLSAVIDDNTSCGPRGALLDLDGDGALDVMLPHSAQTMRVFDQVLGTFQRTGDRTYAGFLRCAANR